MDEPGEVGMGRCFVDEARNGSLDDRAAATGFEGSRVSWRALGRVGEEGRGKARRVTGSLLSSQPCHSWLLPSPPTVRPDESEACSAPGKHRVRGQLADGASRVAFWTLRLSKVSISLSCQGIAFETFLPSGTVRAVRTTSIVQQIGRVRQHG